MRRRNYFPLFALAVVIIHCGYDWTIGTGGASSGAPTPGVGSAPPPGTPPEAGSGSGATNGECGPECTCKDNQQCDFTCPTGRCSLRCSGSSDCKLKCAQGAQCSIACTDNSDCNLDCSAGGSTCTFDCRDDADCKGTCRERSVCTRNCSQRRCNVDCSGSAICL